MAPDIAALFSQHYPIRVEVVAIDIEDDLVRGRVTAIDDDGVTITCVGLKPVTIEWPDLRFIAHDGFPVREYNGPHKVNTEQELTQLRRRLADAEADLSWEKSHRKVDHAGFGDPFEIEGVTAVAAHLGNSGLVYADSFDAEVLLCSSDDGAFGMLWDFETVFELCDTEKN